MSEADPGLERAESSSTFAALQQASGDFLVTSAGWNDDRLADVDTLAEEERLPAINDFLKDFLDQGGAPKTVTQPTAANDERYRLRRFDPTDFLSSAKYFYCDIPSRKYLC